MADRLTEKELDWMAAYVYQLMHDNKWRDDSEVGGNAAKRHLIMLIDEFRQIKIENEHLKERVVELERELEALD